ncbi:putative hydrolase YxeP [Nocardioides dokdonensis FR1436]|uniref:Putative hydrolase YxeP n=1 Tax=Nocardioides dokdonensis FR1436 TaxID=1300347 RepID=A0A1A9GEE5_9ACTN|nr:amidohydrolase [Nocardioides dokdonensis]ANH36699.1 putative hydrolase YxeP [Nocardioides dokdonensis FR1436]
MSTDAQLDAARDARLHDLIRDEVESGAEALVALRRDLHAHPELSWHETRTTAAVAERVEALGWRVERLPGSGLVADLGERRAGPVVGLRADLDALPIQETTGDPWSSTVPGVAHACGHDVHTTALVGAAAALARVHTEGMLPGRVRLFFQPAEEVMPGGAVRLLGLGLLDEVDRVFALHCDPGVDVGQVGLRLGPMTSAADQVDVRLEGTGGHTSRPHLTGDLTFALAKVTTEVPAILSRRFDPRAGVSVVWGRIQAGSAPNVIPERGLLSGTVRILDAVAWADAEKMVRELVHEIVRPYGVTAHVDYTRGVPPVVNEAVSNSMLADAVASVLGPDGRVVAPQSLGGEDFGWYVDEVPGAMMRLGTRTPGGATYDLHQGDLRIDERAIAIGARLLAEVAVRANAQPLR